MTTAAEYRLRDLIERLDEVLLHFHHADETERALTDATALLSTLQSGDVAMNESPTFVAEFADGEVTRMTTFTSLKNLNVSRGVRLARHAYRSRKRQEPPAIVTDADKDMMFSNRAIHSRLRRQQPLTRHRIELSGCVLSGVLPGLRARARSSQVVGPGWASIEGATDERRETQTV